MLKIGDFSKVAHVTVKALRLYAELKLLKPAFIDRYTGYRYYELDQIPRINRILALKELGFSLQQIAKILNQAPSAEELRGMMRLKQAELEQRVREEQERLQRVAARLSQIEHEGTLPNADIFIRPAPAQWTASIRERISRQENVRPRLEELRQELQAALASSGLEPDGWMVLFHNPDYTETNVDVELAALLAADVPARSHLEGRAHFQMFKGLPQTASTAISGGLDALEPAYTAMYAWAAAHGYRVGSPAREIYHPEESHPLSASLLIDIQLPIDPIPTLSDTTENLMEPTIISRPAFLVAGTLYQGKNLNGEIGVMWSEQFLPRLHEVKRIHSDESFGICMMVDGLPDGEFQYIAGGEIASPADVPEGMVMVEVPAHKYAVFAHRGPLETLKTTYAAIYQSWLPAAGYKANGSLDFEFYTREFNPSSPDSILYIYVPID